MLLCLCSKNHEADVLGVFARHPDMPLRLEHVAAWRINWNAKSENIKELADELGLDLTSFVFVDDSGFECAEVTANCPGVLALHLPAPERIPSFLAHVWAFDRLDPTAEDASRTETYRQNRLRAGERERAASLEAFLSHLELEVTIAQAAATQWPRVAQLIQRTNQFNVTTLRRTEAEVRQLCDTGRMECLVVAVSDRFGDYGLVGVVLYEVGPESILIDTFLVSCRALGRKVEHAVLARLAEIARHHRRDRIDIPFVPSARNRPAREFLDEMADQSGQPFGDRWMYRVSAAAAAAASDQEVEAMLAKEDAE
jgi:FkbH-like protein